MSEPDAKKAKISTNGASASSTPGLVKKKIPLMRKRPSLHAKRPSMPSAPGLKAKSFVKPLSKPLASSSKSTTNTPATATTTTTPSPSSSTTTSSNGDDVPETLYFRVVYGKASNRKHKKYSDDGVLIFLANSAQLKDGSDKLVGKCHLMRSGGGSHPTVRRKHPNTMIGQTWIIGSKEMELLDLISEADYLSGKYRLQTQASATAKAAIASPPIAGGIRKKKLGMSNIKKGPGASASPKKISYSPPAHNPDAPDAVVLWRVDSSPRPAVVVDPWLGRKLRPHQREGVQFLFNCVMGISDARHFGALLADEMGLGKTLQAITLLWTLLKQGGPTGGPAVKKAIIVCPATLVGNWAKELKKWLGTERINPLSLGGQSASAMAKTIKDFRTSPLRPVLIVGYELFRSQAKALDGIPIGLIIADEGHRLKNDKIKTTQALAALPTRRRVILSGTPIQNDLDEFYAMISFVNPNIIESPQFFRSFFVDPILRSREPDATETELSVGRERASTLTEITGKFVLRRTAAINKAYLPAKTEAVVIVKLSEVQKELYQERLRSIRKTTNFNNTAAALASLTVLKKICNHPGLVDEERSKADVELSGKLLLLQKLLHGVKKNAPDDRVVVVSNYTATLDVIATMARNNEWPVERLDGSTDARQRTTIVDRFNRRGGLAPTFLFLLSARAGGVGLTLTGANRLVLFDPDWNPATDAQAAARVWRDGQKKEVVIYRFLSTGTLEETIFQRQMKKEGLGQAVDVSGGSKGTDSFSKDELKNLFNLDTKTASTTAALVGCELGGSGSGGVWSGSATASDSPGVTGMGWDGVPDGVSWMYWRRFDPKTDPDLLAASVETEEAVEAFDVKMEEVEEEEEAEQGARVEGERDEDEQETLASGGDDEGEEKENNETGSKVERGSGEDLDVDALDF